MFNPRPNLVTASLQRNFRTRMPGAASCFVADESLRAAAVGFENRQEIISQYDERSYAAAILEFRNREQRRLLAETLDVGACEPFRSAGEVFVVNIGCDRNAVATDLHNVRALRGVRFRERDDVIEASASQESRLDALGPVRSRHQNNALHVAQIIDFSQQLAENSLIDVTAKLFGSKFRRHRVNRVEEQNTRRGPPRLLENFTQRPLRFAQPFRIQLRPVYCDQRNLLFTRK